MVGPDAEACQSSCAAPAELYVYRNPGQEIEQAVSLSGSAYMDLPVALRYRKEFVKGCSCKQAEYNPTEIMAANKQAGIDTGPMPPARSPAPVAGGEAAAPVEITGATPPTDQVAPPLTDQAAPPPPAEAVAPPAAPPPDAVAVEQAPPAPKPVTVPQRQKPPAPPKAAAPPPPPSAAEAAPPPPVAPKPSRTPLAPKASPFGHY
jgi:hypothetical protein